MSTRSTTKVIEVYTREEKGKEPEEAKNTLVSLYRQSDGSPDGHGRELSEFLKDIKIVNGIPSEYLTEKAQPKQRIANGAGCLAAQLVAHFKKGAGRFYLCPIDEQSHSEQYRYYVTVNENKRTIELEIHDLLSSTIIFKGEPGKFLETGKKVAEKETPRKKEKKKHGLER